MRRSLSLGVAAALLAVSGVASAYCPSYTASSSYNSHNCGVEAVNGTNPTPDQWQPIFALVAQGPSVWGSKGPSVSDIGQGCGKPEPLHSVAARFPCEVLKAIAMQESGWKQFCVPSTPADQVGGASRTIISFDCGYGVGQVTSGMHTGESPSFDRSRVASDPTYNLATGTQILASKWKATNCVGDNQPSIVEDWYTAVWAYNGLAYVNNPSNPTYSSSRGVWNPSAGGGAPYQERVFGWVEHPPGNPAYWKSVALAYPNPANVGGSGSPPALPEPSCASPTDCSNKRQVHTSYCFSTNPGDAGTAGSGGSGTGGSSAGGSGGLGTGGSAAGGSGGGNPLPDAAPGYDAGADGSPASQHSRVVGSNSGCACRLGSSDPASGGAPLSLMMIGLLAFRRRRSG